MHDILLGALILFAGFVPVAIALYYSKQLLNKADLLYTMGKAERETTVNEMKKWLLGDEFSLRLKNVFNGMMGAEVKKVKAGIKEEALIQGLPPPAKKAIIDGAGSFIEDYGVSKKTVKGIKAGLEMFFNKKSPQQIQQQDALIKQMAGEYGFPVQGQVFPPQQEQF